MVVASVLMGIGIPGWWVWQNRQVISLESRDLGETRRLIVYNASQADGAPVIVVLDGEKWRHGLATALQSRIFSWLKGSPTSVVIAIDGMGVRELDFRNITSQPAEWRPLVAGRAHRFDTFLINDVFPLAEKLSGTNAKIYLFGHSLGGLYAVDFSIRNPQVSGFAGFAAFSPTFSHDLTILDRLPQLCENDTPGTLSIGLESDEEMALFAKASTLISETEACRDADLRMVRYPGAIHQIVMLPGQTDALIKLVSD